MNEKIDFTIEIDSESNATAFEATLKYDTDVLELISILKEDAWTGDNSVENTGNSTLKFTNPGLIGESSVVTLRFKVKSFEKDITTISIESIKLSVTSDDESDTDTILPHDDIKHDVMIKSDDNTLKNIKIDGKSISGFKSDVYEYTLEVDALSDSVKLEAILNNEQKAAFVEEFGSRNVSLNYGENIVEIKVKSESEKVLIYKLIIIRKDDRLVNNDLKSIILNGGKLKIDFNKNILSYTIKSYKLETIDIVVETDDITSTYEIDAPSKLIIGDNKIKITVTSQTGESKDYNLLIVNSEVPTDSRLKNLSVKGINIGFNADKYDYVIRYDKSYKDGVKIYNTTISNDVETKIIGNQNIKEGSVVKIIVTALDGSSSSEYTITFEKDKRINFFLILDIIIGIVLVALICVQLKKRNKRKKIRKKKEEELSKTKEITL